LNGGRALACSDEHYGSKHNLLLPAAARGMATAGKPAGGANPGTIGSFLRLGHAGRIQAWKSTPNTSRATTRIIVVAPWRALGAQGDADLDQPVLFGPCCWNRSSAAGRSPASVCRGITDLGPISHVRVNMHPDGGLSRVRLFGLPERAEAMSEILCRDAADG